MPRQKHAEKKETFVSSSNEFYSDIVKDEMLYAALVRSPAAGKIASISVPELPEGCVFFSAKDIPGKNEIVTSGTATPVFADNTVTYAGEPVGIIAGKNEKSVLSLLPQIEIKFAEAPESPESADTESTAVKDTTESSENAVAENDAPQTDGDEVAEAASGHDAETDDGKDAPQDAAENAATESPENAAAENDAQNNSEKSNSVQVNIVAARNFSTENFSAQDTPPAEDKTDSEIEISTTTAARLFHENWLETAGAFCAVKNNEITVYTKTKMPDTLRSAVAAVLGIQKEQVFIKTTKASTQGADGLWRTTTIAAQLALVSFLTKNSAKLVLSRSDQNKFMPCAADVSITHRSKVADDGKITKMEIAIDADVGAHNPFAQILLDRLVMASCNIYMPQSISVHACARTSSTPPTSISTRMIDAQAFFAIENHMAEISSKLNLLPTEARLANVSGNKNSTLPFLLKVNEKPAGIENVYQNLIAASGLNRKYVSFMNEAQKRQIENWAFHAIPLRGIGVASAFEGSDYLHPDFFPGTQKVEITLEEDGTVIVKSQLPIPEIKSVWTSMIENKIGAQKSKIKFETPEADAEAKTIIETQQGSLGILTGLFEKCCDDLKKKISQKSKLPITCKKTIPQSVKKQWDAEKFCGFPFHTMTFAAAAVELQIDPYTYRIAVKGIWVVIDCGKVISVPAAERTLRLSIQQEFSSLIDGETIPCESISISFVQSSESPGMIGDIIHNTVPAAFCAALSQATGRDVSRLPYSI